MINLLDKTGINHHKSDLQIIPGKGRTNWNILENYQTKKDFES